MSHKNLRPAFFEEVENIAEYDIVYIGFPIWWYVAPTIINTFLEAHDLKGKQVILFATSGGSGFGDTVKELQKSCNADSMKEGKVWSAEPTDEELLELL